MRNPGFLDYNQLLQALQGGLLVQGGHAHALGAAAHAGQVVLGPEELQAAVGTAVALGAFKDGLAVVKHHGCGIHREIAVGNDAGIAPADSLLIVHQEHMVGENTAETEGGLVRGLLLQVL